MSFPSFLYVEGESQGFISEGACDTGSLPHGMNTGPEDTIRVDEFTWHTHLPVDPHHGQPTGVWQPGEVTLTKLHDRSTPLLHESLCRGERFSRWDFYGQHWQPGQGLAPMFRLQLYGAMVVKIRTRLPHCQNPAEQDLTVLEEVTFSYSGFTVEHLKASTIGGGGKHENPRPLAQAYRRTVAYFNRVFSGQAFKDSVRDLDRALGRALGDPLKGQPGDPSALLGMLGGGGIAGVVKKAGVKGAKELKPTLTQESPHNLTSTQSKAEMSGSQTKRLAKDMKQNGFDQSKPVDVWRNPNTGRLEIQDGHHRTEAAKRAGLDKIPVRVWE